MPKAFDPPVPLPTLGSDTTEIIHENLCVVLTFAFSRDTVQTYFSNMERGDRHRSFHIMIDLPQRMATRALIELAVLFRALDDVQKLTTFPSIMNEDFGKLYNYEEQEIGPLPPREVANKIIHSSMIDWDFEDPAEPLIVCFAGPGQGRHGWLKATIKVTTLVAVIGCLPSGRMRSLDTRRE